ncbi:MAG: O-antigen ligase family protein [Bacteroidales bacterium]|nr:O-antigen ligase family protein [Bacteroidales bacterium]
MFGKTHRLIYLVTLILLAISIPTSKAIPNVLGGVLVANWVLEWNWREKWSLLKQNRTALVMALFFFFFAYGLLWTGDLTGSLKEWVAKTPFLYLPVVMASTPKVEVKWQRFILLAFSITVAVSAALCVIIMQAKGLSDVREGGLFISHIRFSICVTLAILFCARFVVRPEEYAWPVRVGCGLMCVWLLLYLFFVQVSTGILLLVVAAMVSFFYFLFKSQKTKVRNGMLIASGTLFVVFAVSFSVVTYQYFHVDESIEQNLPEKTALGHPYTHDISPDTDGSIVENGHKLGLFVCEEELRADWTKRSAVPYDSIRKTLVRYLNSKGLTKDSEGFATLTDQEIHLVEDSIANVAYLQKFGMKKMLYPTYFTIVLYKKDGTTRNSSLLQRYELWKCGWLAVCDKPWTGYGLSCNKQMIDEKLDEMNSPLKRDMGVHNQFLTFALMGGIPLVLAFLVTLFFPFFEKNRKITLLYFLFWLSLVLSMFFEDTLETTTGVNLFLFFNSFFLFGSTWEE